MVDNTGDNMTDTENTSYLSGSIFTTNVYTYLFAYLGIEATPESASLPRSYIVQVTSIANAALQRMRTIGVSAIPLNAFIDVYKDQTWGSLFKIIYFKESDPLTTEEQTIYKKYMECMTSIINMFVHYVCDKTLIFFDSPSSSYVLEAHNKQLDMYEWVICEMSDEIATLIDENEFLKNAANSDFTDLYGDGEYTTRLTKIEENIQSLVEGKMDSDFEYDSDNQTIQFYANEKPSGEKIELDKEIQWVNWEDDNE